jgi:thiamine biosynthesis lipoprotein
MTSCCVEVRRARPLLGTLVAISAWGTDRAALDAAVDCGFDAVATVHRLMSFQEPDSELSRHNRGAAPAGLHPWTQQVLAAAADLQVRSGGAFDAACGGSGIDLSGIAKGFAVDRAVDALKAASVTRGFIDAGGDLAVFGDHEVAVGVRDPAEPRRLAAIVRLANVAFASSGQPLDPATRRPASASAGASVRAPSCMIADALTKVVGVAGEAAVPLLHELGAAALLFRAGRMVALAD